MAISIWEIQKVLLAALTLLTLQQSTPHYPLLRFCLWGEYYVCPYFEDSQQYKWDKSWSVSTKRGHFMARDDYHYFSLKHESSAHLPLTAPSTSSFPLTTYPSSDPKSTSSYHHPLILPDILPANMSTLRSTVLGIFSSH